MGVSGQASEFGPRERGDAATVLSVIKGPKLVFFQCRCDFGRSLNERLQVEDYLHEKGLSKKHHFSRLFWAFRGLGIGFQSHLILRLVLRGYFDLRPQAWSLRGPWGPLALSVLLQTSRDPARLYHQG